MIHRRGPRRAAEGGEGRIRVPLTRLRVSVDTKGGVQTAVAFCTVCEGDCGIVGKARRCFGSTRWSCQRGGPGPRGYIRGPGMAAKSLFATARGVILHCSTSKIFAPNRKNVARRPLAFSVILLAALNLAVPSCRLSQYSPHGYTREFALMTSDELAMRFQTSRDPAIIDMATLALSDRLLSWARGREQADWEQFTPDQALDLYATAGVRARQVLLENKADAVKAMSSYMTVWLMLELSASETDPQLTLEILEEWEGPDSWGPFYRDLFEQRRAAIQAHVTELESD